MAPGQCSIRFCVTLPGSQGYSFLVAWPQCTVCCCHWSLQESTKAASIITSRASEKGPDNTLYYNFEYSLESTRGNKRLLTTVAVSRKQLFILNIALPEGFLDAPSTTGGKDTLLEELERVQESFQVL